MTTTISVHDISKKYRIGHLHKPTMLREALMGMFRRPDGTRTAGDDVIWALKNVSFDVSQGEVLGIIGRNGAGKSTLLKVLSKITRPTSGTMEVRGRLSSLLEVGTGFHDELTGRENTYMSGSILGMSKKSIEAKMDSIVEFAGVEPFVDTPIKRYSTGMRVRLGFAVAAHLESDILLVDEVLAVGDVQFQKKCLNAMGDLRNVGRTVLFVSHNLAAVENLCTRVLWIEGGKIRLEGSPKEVIREYMASFTTADAGQDLENLESRRGTGDVRFTKVEFLELDRRTPAVIRSGDSFVTRIRFETRQRVLSPIFGMEIHNQQGILISQIHTYNSEYDIPSLDPGTGFLDVVIHDLNLMPGRYYVSLFVANLGNLFHDVLSHCVTFDVEESTRYGSGKGKESNHSLICLPCEWHLGES